MSNFNLFVNLAKNIETTKTPHGRPQVPLLFRPDPQATLWASRVLDFAQCRRWYSVVFVKASTLDDRVTR